MNSQIQLKKYKITDFNISTSSNVNNVLIKLLNYLMQQLKLIKKI